MSAKIFAKAVTVGLIASLAVTAVIMAGIHIFEVAPFNMPPAAAFLRALGLPAEPAGMALHFFYGALWSVLFIGVFRERISIQNGLITAGVMWLLMMIVFSPIMQWGVFGYGAPHHQLPEDNPLYLGNPAKYAILTFGVHMVYGFIMGAGNAWWIKRDRLKSDDDRRMESARF